MAKKSTCLHEQKKIISSYHNPYDKWDSLMVECELCGMYRHETRYSKESGKNIGRIDVSRWINPINLTERK